jgi:hypothetical protein
LTALRLRWDDHYDIRWDADGQQYTARWLRPPEGGELLTGQTVHLITVAMENDAALRPAGPVTR